MSFILGLDLGQTSDPSALVVLDKRPPPDKLHGIQKPSYFCGYITRFHLGTPYADIVRQVGQVIKRPELKGAIPTLAIDQTGVGRPVVETFRAARLGARLCPVTITAGAKVSKVIENGLLAYHVPKKELAYGLQILMQNGRIKIAKGTPEAELLTRELQNFKIKITAAANEVFEAWRAGQHDDLVLALAIAAWAGENTPVGWDGTLGVGGSSMNDAHDPKRNPYPERRGGAGANPPPGVFSAGESDSPW